MPPPRQACGYVTLLGNRSPSLGGPRVRWPGPGTSQASPEPAGEQESWNHLVGRVFEIIESEQVSLCLQRHGCRTLAMLGCREVKAGWGAEAQYTLSYLFLLSFKPLLPTPDPATSEKGKEHLQPQLTGCL